MNGKLNIPPHVAMLTKLLIGAYLLYADYSIFDDMLLMEGRNKVLLIIVMAVFVIAGLALIITSAIGLYKWKFKDSRDDNDGNTEDGGA